MVDVDVDDLFSSSLLVLRYFLSHIVTTTSHNRRYDVGLTRMMAAREWEVPEGVIRFL